METQSATCAQGFTNIAIAHACIRAGQARYLYMCPDACNGRPQPAKYQHSIMIANYAPGYIELTLVDVAMR